MAGLEGVGAHIIGLNLGSSDLLLLLHAPRLDLEEQGHRQNVDWFDGDIKLAMDPTQLDESGRVCLPFHFHVCSRSF